MHTAIIYGMSITADFDFPIYPTYTQDGIIASVEVRNSYVEMNSDIIHRIIYQSASIPYEIITYYDDCIEFCYPKLQQLQLKYKCSPMQILYKQEVRSSEEKLLMQYLLLNRVLPFCATQMECLVLHGSVMYDAIGRYAFCILGESNVGKSTLVAYLIKCGYQLISDDTIVLRECSGLFEVLSGVQAYELHDDSLLLLNGLGLDYHGIGMNRYNNKSIIMCEKKELYLEKNAYIQHVLFLQNTDDFVCERLSTIKGYKRLIKKNIRTYGIQAKNVFYMISRLSQTTICHVLGFPKCDASLRTIADQLATLR